MRVTLAINNATITSMDDVQKLATASSHIGKEWTVSKAFVKRQKIKPGLIDVSTSVRKARSRSTKQSKDENIIDVDTEFHLGYFILSDQGDDQELYFYNGGKLRAFDYDLHDGFSSKKKLHDKVPCTTFPLTWDQREAGLEVYLESDKKPNSYDEFDVHIKTLTGKTITIQVQALDTIAEVKCKIQDAEGIPPDQQRLVVNHVLAENDQTLLQLGAEKGTTLHLVLRLRGGMYHPAAAGRVDFDPVRDMEKFVTVKFGPGESDHFELQLNNGETRESLIIRANEKVTAIRELQGQIDAIKRGADVQEGTLPPVTKKHKSAEEDEDDIEEKSIKQE